MAATPRDTPQPALSDIRLDEASFLLIIAEGEHDHGCLSSFLPSLWHGEEPPCFAEFSFRMFEERALTRASQAPTCWIAIVGDHMITFGHQPSWLVAIACLESWLKLGLTLPEGPDITFMEYNTGGILGRVTDIKLPLKDTDAMDVD